MKKLLNFIKNSCFLKSFKELDKRIFIVMGAELALIISVFLIFVLSTLFLKTSIDKLGISENVMEEIKENMDDRDFANNFLQTKMRDPNFPQKLKSFLAKLLSNVLILIIAIIVVISFFKSLIWSKVAKIKFKKSFFTKFLGLFLSWNIPWILLFIIIALSFKEKAMKYFITAEFLFFIYFSLIIYPLFVKENRIFSTIKKTFKIGLINLYKFILPIILIWLMFQLGFTIIILLSKIPTLVRIFLIVYALFYISWIKFYMLKVVEKVA